MSRVFAEFWQAFVGQRQETRPPDLQAFDEARKRLVTSARGLAREADQFGKMVREMRGDRRKKPRKACSK